MVSLYIYNGNKVNHCGSLWVRIFFQCYHCVSTIGINLWAEIYALTYIQKPLFAELN